MSVEAYPLQWPMGRPQTPIGHRSRARFKKSQDRARRDIIDQVRKIGGINLVISTNCELRRDGFPRSDRRPPDDCGVAVYYTDRHGKLACFACDIWDTVEDNMTAIASTIDAIRGIERWGGQQASDQAFSGFAALPPSVQDRAGQPWHVVMNLLPTASREEIDQRYRQLAKERHPDRGNPVELMQDLNRAYQEARGS